MATNGKKGPRPACGVEFPFNETDMRRSTMGINKRTFAKAMQAVNEEKAKALDDLPEKKWRRAYQRGVVDNVRESAKTPENAIAVAKAGLDYLHDTMVFVRPKVDDRDAKPAGPEMSLKEAMKKYTVGHTDKKFYTHEIDCRDKSASKEFSVQYKPFGTEGKLKDLSGNELRRQIDTWVKTGAIEKDCGVAMTRVVDNKEWCDLSDKYFVLFGASSAMGPLFKLLEHGANVIAIDLDRKGIWEGLIKACRFRSGKLIIPVKEKVPEGATDDQIATIAGCNLLEDAPEIRNWLQELVPKSQLVCVALAYLDGELFVKLSMAMDAIIASLVEKRGADKMGVAYLCTPTDAHLCTASSVADAKSRFGRAPAWQKLLAMALSSTTYRMQRNVEKPILDADGKEIDGLQVVDCIVPQQGPNYILAKRLQHWRAMVSRSEGVLASSNIAPSTATASVLSNPMFALSYNGMPNMKPMEITYQETSNSVMAALLIRDVNDPSAAANPQTKLPNPLCLFGESAWHGGCWRTGYKFDSLGAPATAGYVASAFMVDPYLLCYSVYQAVCWYQVLFAAISSLQATSYSSVNLWKEAYPTLTFCQHLGFMEVLHAAFGFVRSDPFSTFIQIFSRVFIIAVVNQYLADFEKDTFVMVMMLMAWSIADSTRYVYYAVGQLKTIATSMRLVACALKLWPKKIPPERAPNPVFQIPFFLTWLRYSLFIVLYPSGVFGELSCIWKTSLSVTDLSKVVGVNSFSTWLLSGTELLVGGNLNRWLAIVGVAYGVGLPMLMMMLLASRKKQLSRK